MDATAAAMSEPTDRDADNVPSDRVRAYVEALRQMCRCHPADDDSGHCIPPEVARACVAVEERHTAALRAEVARWKRRAFQYDSNAAAAQAEVERLRADLDAVEDEKTALYHDRQGVIREVERLRATVARVEAMATAWETPPVRINSIRSEVIAHHIREALRGPEPTEDSHG